MIHEDEEVYITRRGEVIHKGIRCERISAEELTKRFPSLRIDKHGHVRVGKKKKQSK